MLPWVLSDLQTLLYILNLIVMDNYLNILRSLMPANIFRDLGLNSVEQGLSLCFVFVQYLEREFDLWLVFQWATAVQKKNDDGSTRV